jgi:hypothetical protein
VNFNQAIQMKKLLRLIAILCIIISIKTKAQDQFCGNHTADHYDDQTESFIQNFVKNKQNLRPSADPIFIPIKLHVVVPDNGDTRLAFFTTKAFNQSLAYTNSLFKKINIQFFVSGAINYIKSSKHQNLVINSTDFVLVDGYSENRVEQELCVPHEIPNAINLFFVNNLTLNGGLLQNYAKLPNATSITKLSSYRVMMNGLSIGGYGNIKNPVLAHELGHFLSLHHPFDEVGGKELVTRGTGSNCDRTGDLLCDTPADPQPSVSAADKLLCGDLPPNYRDANGEIYKPDMTNVMTYYSNFCKVGFTQGQYDRMLAGLALRKTNATFGKLDAPDVQVNAPTITGINNYNNGANYLFFTDNSNNETGFIIERATSANGDFVVVGGVGENVRNFGDEFSDIDKFSATTHYYRIRPSNSKTEYSNVFAVNTREKTVCVPPINIKCGEISNIMIFRNIKANGTNLNDSYVPCNNPLNYIMPLKVINFQSNTDYVIEGTVALEQSYRNVYAWIDRNRNGVFDANERIFATNFSPTNLPPNANFSFPFSTKDLAGNYTIRLRVAFATSLRDACEGGQHGETIDYNISVLGAYAVKAGAIATTNYCPNASLTVPITYDGTAPTASTTYKLQVSDNQGNNYRDLTTTVDGTNLKANLPADIRAGTGYRIKVVTGGPVSESISPTIITIDSPPSATISASKTSIFAGEEVKLTLTFVGSPPFSYTLSDATKGTANQNSVELTLKPDKTTTYTVQSVSNACGNGTASGSVEIKVEVLLSNNPELKDIIRPYPNPTDTNLRIDLGKISNGQKAVSLELFDQKGKRVWQKSSRELSEDLDTSNLTVGIYFLKVKSGEYFSTHKIVKQ